MGAKVRRVKVSCGASTHPCPTCGARGGGKRFSRGKRFSLTEGDSLGGKRFLHEGCSPSSLSCQGTQVGSKASQPVPPRVESKRCVEAWVISGWEIDGRCDEPSLPLGSAGEHTRHRVFERSSEIRIPITLVFIGLHRQIGILSDRISLESGTASRVDDTDSGKRVAVPRPTEGQACFDSGSSLRV
jgi:hypothetical protein